MFGRFALPAIVLAISIPGVASSQDEGANEQFGSLLEERTVPEFSEFRAIAPQGGMGYLVAAVVNDPSGTIPSLHVVDHEGVPGPGVSIGYPPGEWALGGRIDRLIAVPGGFIGVGNIARSKEDRRGWVVRLDGQLETLQSVALPYAHPQSSVSFYYSGVIDGEGRLVVAGRSEVAEGEGERWPVSGVVAVLDPESLDLLLGPTEIETGTDRAGFQDIDRAHNGQLVAVGWWQKPGEGDDLSWIVTLDDTLSKTGERTFGGDAGTGTNIAHRVVRHPAGTMAVFGSQTGREDALASLHAVDLVDEGGGRTDPVATQVDALLLHESRSATFRTGLVRPDATIFAVGLFLDEEGWRSYVSVYEDVRATHPILEECASSYLWDIAESHAGGLLIAGYCADSLGVRQAALVVAPPESPSPTSPVVDAPTLGPVIALQELGGESDGLRYAFELGTSQRVQIFAAGGVEGVLTLLDAEDRLIDHGGVAQSSAAVVEVSLEAGRYYLGWSSPQDAAPAQLIVRQMPAEGMPDVQEFEPDGVSLRAMALMGYAAAGEALAEDDPRYTAPLRREIVAYQLTRSLPPSGFFGLETNVSLAIDAAQLAQERAAAAAARADDLAAAAEPEILEVAGAEVLGAWQRDAFLGVSSEGGEGFSGEWRITSSEGLNATGVGRLEASGVGYYEGEVTGRRPKGFGVLTRLDDGTRFVGEFEGEGRGAIFKSGTILQAGIFEEPLATSSVQRFGVVVQSVAVPR